MEKWQSIANEFFKNEYEEYKSQVYKNRNPKDIKFSTIESDILRRDITCSGLFYDFDKREIIDLVDGISDINNKIIRFIGEPILRIIEDPLRIMRLIRYTTRYRFVIDLKSYNAIKGNKNKLSIIVKERIWEEINKSWEQSIYFEEYIKYLIELGIVDVIFPNLKLNKEVINCSTLEFFFANLFKSNSTENLLDRMKLEFKMEHNFARKVVFLIELLDLTPENSLEMFRKRDVCKASSDELLEWYTISKLSNSKTHTAFLYFKPTVKAEELMSQGFKNKALGDEIKKLELEKFKKIVNEI